MGDLATYEGMKGEWFKKALEDATGLEWVEVVPGNHYKHIRGSGKGDGSTWSIEHYEDMAWDYEKEWMTFGFVISLKAPGVARHSFSVPHYEAVPEYFAEVARKTMERVGQWFSLAERVRNFTLWDD